MLSLINLRWQHCNRKAVSERKRKKKDGASSDDKSPSLVFPSRRLHGFPLAELSNYSKVGTEIHGQRPMKSRERSRARERESEMKKRTLLTCTGAATFIAFLLLVKKAKSTTQLNWVCLCVEQDIGLSFPVRRSCRRTLIHWS